MRTGGSGGHLAAPMSGLNSTAGMPASSPAAPASPPANGALRCWLAALGRTAENAEARLAAAGCMRWPAGAARRAAARLTVEDADT